MFNAGTHGDCGKADVVEFIASANQCPKDHRRQRVFNSRARREAIAKLKRSVTGHEAIRKRVEKVSIELFELRRNAATDGIQQVESYVNTLANSPKEFDTMVAEFRVEADRFRGTVQRLETEASRSTMIGSATGTAGVAAGVGVAALGPSAAMAGATTFGTASTGTAISALSGAAATNAGLAWLGGGALAAGGGGMAGGSTLLALAGPVGWGVGGAVLVGSGLYLNSRNRKHAREANDQRIKVEADIRALQSARHEISGLHRRTSDHSAGCRTALVWLRSTAPNDYRAFNDEQKERLAALINHIRSLSELLRAEVTL